MLFTGFTVFLISLGYLAMTYFTWLIGGGQSAPGWRSIITLAFMLGAANLIAISIVGEYVCRNYFQSKQRPRFIIAGILETTSRHSLPPRP